MARILLLEDDFGIGTSLELNLKYERYAVDWARDLRTARELVLRARFDLGILDVGLPDGNGIEFCQALRAQGHRWPILMLTAQSDEDSVVAGLRAGANDYVRKPFGQKELLARVQIALGEIGVREDNLRFGALTLARAQRRGLVDGRDLELSPSEFEILLVLAENGGAVVTRERLMDHLDKDGEIGDRVLDSHLSHIRKKLKGVDADALKIVSAYGVGYSLEKL